MKAKFTLISLLAASLSAPAICSAQQQYSTPTSTPSASQKLTIEQLPQPAQATIRQEAAGREIAKIERANWNSQPGYRVQFKEPGRNPDIYVAESGTLLRPEEKPPGVATLFMGTTFDKTPAAVQDTLRREVGTGEITKIDREGKKGARYYKVYVKDPQGATYELQVGEDGKIQQDSRRTGSPMSR